MRFLFLHFGFLLCLAFVATGGCGKRQPAPPQAIAVEQVAPSLQEVFKGANPETQKIVDSLKAGLEAKDYGKASLVVDELAARSDLSPRQRDFAIRSLLSVKQALSEQATSGNQRAQEVIQFQRKTK